MFKMILTSTEKCQKGYDLLQAKPFLTRLERTRPMDRELLIAYREAWQAVEKIEKEENKHASIEQRWNQVNAIYNLAIGLGLVFEDPRDQEDIVWQRWSRLKHKNP